jgi:hypothetical protein
MKRALFLNIYLLALLYPFANAQAQGSSNIKIDGGQEAVFTYNTDKCNDTDFPDNIPRLIVDKMGNLQLLASNSQNYYRSLWNPLTRHFDRQCEQPVLTSGLVALNASPADYYNQVWIDTVWVDTDSTIYGFVHNEFHGEKQNSAYHYCDSKDLAQCWYANLIAVKSTDFGQSYQIMRTKDLAPHLVASTPYRYEADGGRQDMAAPSNIVQKDGYYYMLVGGALEHGFKPGFCLYRTKTIAKPSSWRAWKSGVNDNDGFVVKTINPYKNLIQDPKPYICTPVLDSKSYMSLTYNKRLRKYLAIGQDPNWQNTNQYAVIYSVSSDLINWSNPQAILGIPTDLKLDKPSLIDQSIPNQDANFQYSGLTPYLYFIVDNGDADRDIVRYPLRISQTP